MKLAFAAPLAFAAALFVSPVQATPYQSATGLVAPAHTITFDELGLARGTVVTTQYAGLGASFVGTWQNPDFGGAFPNIVRNGLTDFAPGGKCPCGPTFEIVFSGPVRDAVFAFVTGLSTLGYKNTLTSYLGASFVETYNFPSGIDGAFTGFTGSRFDRIVVAPGGSGHSGLIDFLEFNTAIPEPASLALLGAGLLGLAGVRRRG